MKFRRNTIAVNTDQTEIWPVLTTKQHQFFEPHLILLARNDNTFARILALIWFVAALIVSIALGTVVGAFFLYYGIFILVVEALIAIGQIRVAYSRNRHNRKRGG